ncbi:hypothetical protein NDK47_08330 [Brevibacillus ruminantium]|uniref:Lipoprotein n=1 Tax=Brevibacillus ruminantium TaxID=2950604 RepID=A0ABY4WJF4_9BACL|nr:hypothetical protein [Brevibacillus ruminantium]USG67266.1 hypothetical protein NDK47_08330 [Brevibacillus ruminantium]
MPIWLLLLAITLTGCVSAGKSPDPARTNAVLNSDKNMYYQQSVVLPMGMEPNATPYGTPANFGTAGEYDRPLRSDSVSHYPGWEPVR